MTQERLIEDEWVSDLYLTHVVFHSALVCTEERKMKPVSIGGKRKEERKKKKKKNKAGYTAISCGRVGRGGYACFLTFRLVLTDGQTDGPTDGPTDGRTEPLIELSIRD